MKINSSNLSIYYNQVKKVSTEISHEHSSLIKASLGNSEYRQINKDVRPIDKKVGLVEDSKNTGKYKG